MESFKVLITKPVSISLGDQLFRVFQPGDIAVLTQDDAVRVVKLQCGHITGERQLTPEDGSNRTVYEKRMH